jgi:hypothetical protein
MYGKGNFFPVYAMRAQWGNGVVAAVILNVSTRWRLAANFTARPHAAKERAGLGALEKRKIYCFFR